MNKQTKTLLGVAVVAGLGYYFWKQSQQQPKSFANFDLKNECQCHNSELVGQRGETIYSCGDGVSLARSSKGKCPQRAKSQVIQ
jgi:hypothetical protein